MRPCNVAFHSSSDNCNDFYPKRSKLDAKSLTIGMQSRFGGIVDGTPNVRDCGSDGADLYNCAFGAEK